MLGVARLDDAGLGHFQPQVVAFAGALADSGKYGESAVLLSDVINQFHDDYGLAHARAAEQPDFAAFQKWLNEVDDFDAGFEHLSGCGLFIEKWRGAVDWHGLSVRDGTQLVDGLADHVHHTTERAATNGHGDRSALVNSFHAAHHALGCFHGDAANAAFAQVLLHFDDDIDREGDGEAVAHNTKRLINRRHGGFNELIAHGWAGDLKHISNVFWHKSSALSFWLLAFSLILSKVESLHGTMHVTVS